MGRKKRIKVKVGDVIGVWERYRDYASGGIERELIEILLVTELLGGIPGGRGLVLASNKGREPRPKEDKKSIQFLIKTKDLVKETHQEDYYDLTEDGKYTLYDIEMNVNRG